MSDPALTVDAVLTDDLREWLTAGAAPPRACRQHRGRPPSQSVMWFDLDPDEPDTILMNTMVRPAQVPPAAA